LRLKNRKGNEIDWTIYQFIAGGDCGLAAGGLRKRTARLPEVGKHSD
jgi:hypothetical protein